jgi:hypothetical protein
MPQSCFFTTRKDSEGKVRMCPICLSCGKGKQEYWFWEGTKLGYGVHKIVCQDCQKVIHDPNAEATNKSAN